MLLDERVMNTFSIIRQRKEQWQSVWLRRNRCCLSGAVGLHSTVQSGAVSSWCDAGMCECPSSSRCLLTELGPQATWVLVVGYSWIDGNLVVVGSPGIGWGVTWRRWLTVLIGKMSFLACSSSNNLA